MNRLPGLIAVLLLGLGAAPAGEARGDVPSAPAAPARASGVPRTARIVAQRAPAASCTLTEILATSEKKGIDPKLKKLESKLRKPPFTAWDTFSLLGEATVRTDKDKPASAKLVTKGTLGLIFKDKLLSQGGRPRLRYALDMDSAAGKRIVSTVVVFDSGDSLLFAGEPHGQGTYILALSCTAQ